MSVRVDGMCTRYIGCYTIRSAYEYIESLAQCGKLIFSLRRQYGRYGFDVCSADGFYSKTLPISIVVRAQYIRTF